MFNRLDELSVGCQTKESCDAESAIFLLYDIFTVMAKVSGFTRYKHRAPRESQYQYSTS